MLGIISIVFGIVGFIAALLRAHKTENKEEAKGLMKKGVFALVFFVACGGILLIKDVNEPVDDQVYGFAGGILQSATFDEWKRSTDNNKMATTTVWIKFEFENKYGTMEKIPNRAFRDIARSIITCMDTTMIISKTQITPIKVAQTCFDFIQGKAAYTK